MWQNRTKERLLAGETVCGPFLRMPGPISMELAAAAGFDFAVIDLELGVMDNTQLESMIMAARGAGITPMVRLREVNGSAVQQALDLGVQGVMAPQVGSPGDAAVLSGAARFAPVGHRAMGGGVRGNGWGSWPADAVDRQVLTLAQIESLGGLEHLDAIAGDPGIDVLFVGPFDLSQAMGIPGQITHPRLIAAVEDVIAAARRAGKVAGIFTGSAEAARYWSEKGCRLIGTGLDTGLLKAALVSLRNELR
jgi:2-keto-3-deoxy-L-rhamnonate aldolase RhmA